MGTFIEEQKVVNVQANQKIDIVESKIDTVESSLNKKLDGFQSGLNQKIEKALQLATCSSKGRESRGRVPD